MARRKRYKGCCMLCALHRGTFKGNYKGGTPFRVKRQLGRLRRLSGAS